MQFTEQILNFCDIFSLYMAEVVTMGPGIKLAYCDFR